MLSQWAIYSRIAIGSIAFACELQNIKLCKIRFVSTGEIAENLYDMQEIYVCSGLRSEKKTQDMVGRY